MAPSLCAAAITAPLHVYYCSDTLIHMDFDISPNAPTPIYRQIVEQVRRMVASGQLKAGDALPSVRAVAVHHAINPMTVSKAYSLLETEQLVVRLRGVGMAIADAGGTSPKRDKLAMLRAGKDQAFYGAPLVSFPHLDASNVKWFCDNADLSSSLDPIAVYGDFERAGFRPEVLDAALDALRFDFELTAENISQKFQDAVAEQIAIDETRTLRVIRSLTPLQSAILRVLVVRGDLFAPFEATTMAAYQMVHDKLDGKSRVTSVEFANVQQALTALQEKKLVWKETRGVYALEESTTGELMRRESLLKLVPDWSVVTNSEASDPPAQTPPLG